MYCWFFDALHTLNPLKHCVPAAYERLPDCTLMNPAEYAHPWKGFTPPVPSFQNLSFQYLFQNQIPLIALRVHTNESRSSWLQDLVRTPSPTPAVICVYCFTRGSLGWAQPSWEHLCYNPALNTISSPGIVVEMV